MLGAPDEPLLFQPACDDDGLLAKSLLRGFCSFGGTGEAEAAGDCLSAEAHDDLAFILNQIAESMLAADTPVVRIAELGTDGCAPTGADDALAAAYGELRNRLLGF